MIPDEVHDRVMRMFGAVEPYYPQGIKEVDPMRVIFVDKRTVARSDGWAQAIKRQPMLEGKINPWRKCHTEHYWCWFLKIVSPKI